MEEVFCSLSVSHHHLVFRREIILHKTFYKKWLSVALAALMLLSLSIPLNASANTAPITLENAVPGEGKLLLGEEPLANLTFSLYSTGENQIWYDFTTDENGNFTYHLPDGEFTIDGIWVSPTWYPLGKTFTIQNGLIDGLHAFVINALELQYEGNVSGTLKNGSTPMPNLTFSIHRLEDNNWYDTRTDTAGNFVFNLPNGTYQLDGIWEPETQNWYELNQPFTVSNGSLSGLQINVATASHLPNVMGTLNKGSETLSDVVFSIRTASGEEKWYDSKTDANGRFATYLPTGSYVIEGIWEASAGKWHVLQKEFTVTGETLQLNIDVLADGPAELPANVTGVLKKGNEVLPGVVFSVHTNIGEEKWYDTVTDANGHFNMQLPDGSYILEGIWNDGEGKWYPLQMEFTVNSTKELVIDLNAPKIVSGADFSGTLENPKVYAGDVTVDATGVTKLENAIVKGNLILKGNASLEIVNVTVEGETIFED
jgi:hypothetical protein